ncbi:uncharacterized protein LOC110732096 [Chenopodium quinoa]|uniref:uncharacterized protein LOC110732096 n=1 Tax=Chenopodium quinoa TaxID=63459 RepID=UPI000B77149A|nr:uncharacterized protein LOC110732096 [Chenopodium quinoa]
MGMMGELNFFLGLQIKQTEEGIMIHQQKYIKELIKKYKMDNVETNKNLMGLCARSQANPKESHLKVVKRILRYLKGTDDLSLFYPRSDSFYLNGAVKRILRYLKGTDDLSLFYPRCDSFDLNGFTDADYEGDLVNRKSTSGMAQFLGSCLVSWSSKKQKTVALSTVEAEYVAAAACCSQVLWIKQQVRDFGIIF